MILRIFTLTLEPEHPLQFSLPALRASLTRGLAGYSAGSPAHDPEEKIIHRYPAIQCKQLKSGLMAVGVCQGADYLHRLSEGNTAIADAATRCTIVARDRDVRKEEFGIDGRDHDYEFATPYLALNQQYAKKFYDLNGKPARDAFMQKILASHLSVLAKSLDYSPGIPVTCTAHLKFERQRIDRENVIVFLGKFTTNLAIPDYLGIGQSVSGGYGTIRRISGEPAGREKS